METENRPVDNRMETINNPVDNRMETIKETGLPTLLFAAATAFLLHGGYRGLNVTLEAAAAVFYAVCIVKKAGLSLCPGSRLILTGILLQGLSCFLTGSGFLQAVNTSGIFFLFLLFFVLNFRRPSPDDFGENLNELVLAPIRGIGGLGSAYKELSSFIGNKRSGWKKLLLPVLAGLAVSPPLVILIFWLLCSADAVFRDFFSEIAGRISWAPVTISVSALLWFAFTYSTLRSLGEQRETAGQAFPVSSGKDRRGKHRENANPVTGITVCVPIALIYLVFSVIQIVFLFLRNSNLPAGCSYAEYVHEGFYQLLAACVLNLLLVLFMKEYFRRSRALDILLTVIGGCTYIMTASSALRTVLYVRAYGLTFLRVLVLWSLTVIAVLFAGVLIRIWHGQFPLFRYMLTAVFSAWLLLSFARPDYFIAVYDLHYTEAKADLDYLSFLSADAAPVLYEYAGAHLPGDESEWSFEEWDLSCYLQKDRSPENWREINLADLIAERYRTHEK